MQRTLYFTVDYYKKFSKPRRAPTAPFHIQISKENNKKKKDFLSSDMKDEKDEKTFVFVLVAEVAVVYDPFIFVVQEGPFYGVILEEP